MSSVALHAGLGYVGSETARRTETGICTTDQSVSVLVPLLNYPVAVKVSKVALEKLNQEFRASCHHRIDIDAVVIDPATKDEKNYRIFTINHNFFARLYVADKNEF